MAEEKLLENLGVLSRKAQIWNAQVFGNVFYRKRRLLARLASLQKALESHTTRNLRKLESEVREELERVLTQEELLSTRRQGADWVYFGDRNSAWFHKRLKTRNNREVVSGLKIEEITWCNNHQTLKEKTGLFFREVFGCDEMENK